MQPKMQPAMHQRFKALPIKTQLTALKCLHFAYQFYLCTELDVNVTVFDENTEAQLIFENVTGKAISDFMCTQGQEFDVEAVCDLLTDFFEVNEPTAYSGDSVYDKNAKYCSRIVDYLWGETNEYPN
ncbi:hypothetical protein [Vibrio phage vB_VibM_83AMN]|nr:hypothetical protein [Vibrio phage vB_VibM_83AMN]